ncbi:UDP-N-acetylmuramate dehydrogenase [Flammeovirga aprica]|uniref:UDP-N-acetylenolpyruvoylglucosamine reductase n=1 Tax=Flammeovirga aprica JL-4 TaxID=694437 RepID=A0A7X9S0J9_9BACT|nr:UDP-N-acetylmuramate dehydrogenase [Flammeovirga aprica]NME72227.1 UDP-N-acetylmuramate dehydrogenase [Flammeovirga aprica JL-4]
MKIHQNISLKDHNYWKIGGEAKYFCEPTSLEDIIKAITFATAHSIPFIVIGRGSNLLFDSNGVNGLIIKIGEAFSNFEFSANKLICQAGAWVPGLARNSVFKNLSGLEHTIGIPCTVGGLVHMNGGSLRKNIGENIEKVIVLNTDDLTVNTLYNKDCQFQYRSSIFLKKKNLIILEIHILLQPIISSKEKHEEMLGILKNRSAKFPRKQPNCGSVFLSSPDLYQAHGAPGAIIEDLGLKGISIGGARVSKKHANFIINEGDASSSDVINLIKYIAKTAKERKQITLKSEVLYISPEGDKICITNL